MRKVSYIIGCFLPLIFAGCSSDPDELDKAESQKTKAKANEVARETTPNDVTEIKLYEPPDVETKQILNSIASLNNQDAYVFQVTGKPASFKLRVGWYSDDLQASGISIHEANKLDELFDGKTLLNHQTLRFPNGDENRFVTLLIPKESTARLSFSCRRGNATNSYFDPLNIILPKTASGMKRSWTYKPMDSPSFAELTLQPGKTEACFFQVIQYEGNGVKRWITYTLTATGLPDEAKADESK